MFDVITEQQTRSGENWLTRSHSIHATMLDAINKVAESIAFDSSFGYRTAWRITGVDQILQSRVPFFETCK